MATQAELYQNVIRAGGSPAEAQYLSAIAMAESGGQSVKSRVDRNSWGPWQINLDAHKQYTVAQAMDPVFSATIALNLARNRGSYRDWSMFNNGGYQQYMGSNAMPQSIIQDPWGDIARGDSPFGGQSGGGAGGVSVVIDPNTGLPFMRVPSYDDVDGTFLGYDYRPLPSNYYDATNPQGRQMQGGLLPTQIPGLMVNPNTGAIVDLRQSQTRDITARPISGTDVSGLYDQSGNLIDTAPTPRYGTNVSPVSGMQGLYSVTDANGRIYNVGGNYQTPLDVAQVTGDYNGQRTLAGQQVDWTRQYQQGQQALDVGQLTGTYGGQRTLAAQQFDTTNQRLVDQFNADLQERIASRQQEITTLQMQLTSLERRADQEAQTARAQIAAQLQIAKGNQATDLAIARMDSSTKLSIARTQANVEQRGQDIGAQVSYRGQDIGREANIMNAQQGRAQFAVQALRDDPVSQAIYLSGGSGGTSPLEQAATDWQIPDLPTINAAPPLPARMAEGGVIHSDEPVMAVVGEKTPSSAELALLPPGARIVPLNLPRGASREDMNRAVARKAPQIYKMAGGGSVRSWSDVYRTVSAPRYPASTYWAYGIDPSSAGATQQLEAAMAQRQQPQKDASGVGTSWEDYGGNPLAKLFGGLSEMLGGKKPGDGTTPTPTPPPVQPVNPNQPGGSVYDTMNRALNDAYYGGGAAAPGDLAPMEPLYGVTPALPGELAARWGSMSGPQRTMAYSGWGVRNLPQEEADRMRLAVTPVGINPISVGYGQDGLVIMPVAA